MSGYYVDGPLSPKAEPTTAGGAMWPEDTRVFEEADPHYRAGPLTADELARQEAGGDQFTTADSMGSVTGSDAGGHAESPEYFEDSTVAELKDELEERGLPKSGNKPELIERLAADEAEDE